MLMALKEEFNSYLENLYNEDEIDEIISYSLVIPGSILIVCPLIKNISQKSQAGIIAKAKAKADENAAEYFCVGSEGRILTVYSDRVSLITRPKLLVGNYANGEKTIFYADCIGVQFSLSGGSRQLGYLQFETASAMASSSSSVARLSTYYNENTFIWYSGKTGVTNEQMEVVTKYIQEKIANHKQARISTTITSNSSADELKKYKDLLDAGIITQEEFDAKKKQLLGL